MILALTIIKFTAIIKLLTTTKLLAPAESGWPREEGWPAVLFPFLSTQPSKSATRSSPITIVIIVLTK